MRTNTLELSENTKIKTPMKAIIAAIGFIAVSGFAIGGWMTAIHKDVEDTKESVSKGLKKVEHVNRAQQEQIDQGKEMISELKAQTAIMMKAVEKIDERTYRLNQRRGP